MEHDTREDLHNLYHPILKSIEWYSLDKYNLFMKMYNRFNLS